MECAVLNIGDEVLIGDTINTNLSLIAKMAREYDISVEEQITIKDIKEEIIKKARYLLNKYDILITTGGLGPTEDDLTTESIAQAFDRELVLDEKTLEDLENYFKSAGRHMSSNNKKQAYFPQGATIYDNDNGTASGFSIEVEGKYVLVLPGPPREAKNILEKFLEKIGTDTRLLVKIINAYEIGESDLEFRMRKLNLSPNISVNTYFGSGNVDIKLIAHNAYEKDMDQAIEDILEEFDSNIFAIDSPSIAHSLVKKLSQDKKTIAIAESCTGGKIASLITQVPGASESLLASLVTYSNLAKIKELKVDENLIEEHTAVSEEVCTDMIEGLRQKYDADYYAATTGYASAPDDPSLKGLIFTGIYSKEEDKINIYKNVYNGTREQIIERASYNVLNKIYRLNGGKLDDRTS